MNIQCFYCKAVGPWADGFALDNRARYKCAKCRATWTHGSLRAGQDTPERVRRSRIGLMLWRRFTWDSGGWQLRDAAEDEVAEVERLAKVVPYQRDAAAEQNNLSLGAWLRWEAP